MKKALLIILLSLTVLMFTSCEKDNDTTDPNAPNIDIDLTKMSSNVASAQIGMFYENEQDYMGKTVKIRGTYYPFFVDDEELIEHNITLQYIVFDCPSGCNKYLEFIDADKTYPDDYPDEDTLIEITGVFDRYDLTVAESFARPYFRVTEFKIVE
ncbi:MAG: hypothetical protein FWG45_05440 [Oscillospiraceae bacterium]|nr:hypothetical protein [Oscillospiraceae bacterium]